MPTRHTLLRLTLPAAAIAIVAGCGAPPSSRERALRSFRATVAADVATVDGRPVTLTACGDVRTTYSAFLGSSGRARDCFGRAFAGCRPALVTGTYHGVDSGPFYWTATVLPSAGGCEIRLYTDDRLDKYGSATIERKRCVNLSGGACDVVWRQPHLLCRSYPGGADGEARYCIALPPEIVWRE